MAKVNDGGTVGEITGAAIDIGGQQYDGYKAVADINGNNVTLFDTTSGGSSYENLADDVPSDAITIRNNEPSYSSKPTVSAVDEGYDGRSGDVTELIQTATANGQIVDLEDGEYNWSREITTAGSHPHHRTIDTADLFGVIGNGATVYADIDDDEVFGDGMEYFIYAVNMGTILLNGITFDIRGETSNGYVKDVGLFLGNTDTEMWVRDIDFRGRRRRMQNGQATGGYYNFQSHCNNSNATAYINNMNFPDGADFTGEEGETHHGMGIAISVENANEGTVVFEDCSVLEWDADNGFYVANHNANSRAVIIDCHARNCMSGNMRISHNDTIVGGLAEVTRIPGTGNYGPSGNGTPLVFDKGAGGEVIGLTIQGDSYGNNAITVREEAESVTLDRVVMDVDGDRQPIGMSTSSDVPNATVNLVDCYLYDSATERFNTASHEMFRVGGAEVYIDDETRILSENYPEFQNDGYIEIEGVGQLPSGSQDAPSSVDSPLPLPEFYIEY